MLLNWKEEIMNSFIRVNQRRLSNGPIENINSQIKTIMKSANGYKEFYRLRNRIFYTLNRDTPIKW
jgi:transposase